MPAKATLLEHIDLSLKKLYTKGEVKNFINSVSSDAIKTVPYIKKFDVLIIQTHFKKRPVVVVKVMEDVCWGIPLSTTEDCMNLIKSQSRLFEGYFSKTLVAIPIDLAMTSFAGIYDNPKLVNKAIKALKNEVELI